VALTPIDASELFEAIDRVTAARRHKGLGVISLNKRSTLGGHPIY